MEIIEEEQGKHHFALARDLQIGRTSGWMNKSTLPGWMN
jgi:hypothetical protein